MPYLLVSVSLLAAFVSNVSLQPPNFHKLPAGQAPPAIMIRTMCQINDTLTVVVVLEKPWVMLKKDALNVSGSEMYEGFLIDLLEQLSTLCDLRYIVRVSQDGLFGVKDEKGEWNGMIGEVLRKEADMIALMAITYERSQVVEFSASYEFFSMSVLMKKPTTTAPSVFGFLSPFGLEVWRYIGLALIIFTLSLWIISKWDSLRCCYTIPESSNQFSLFNSIWYTTASLLCQGTNLDVSTLSARFLMANWWVFTFVLMSSYTANLAAFLTINRSESSIKNLNDLIKQTQIKVGVLAGSAEYMFFKNAQFQPYQSMFARMSEAKPSVFVNSIDEALMRVSKGDYAFIGERGSISYLAARNCELLVLDDQITSLGGAMALRKDSPYKQQLSHVLLWLSGNTWLTGTKEKWFNIHASEEICKEGDLTAQGPGLSMQHLGGLFIMLAIGLGISYILAVAERLYQCFQARKKNSEQSNDTTMSRNEPEIERTQLCEVVFVNAKEMHIKLK